MNFCRSILDADDAVMEIVLRLAGSNDRAREREVHFRPDRNDVRTSGSEEEKEEGEGEKASKDEISAAVARYFDAPVVTPE